MNTTPIFFSKFPVTKQVFFKSNHSFALVNLKPLVAGHVLVVPLRTECISLSDLTVEENKDYFATLHLIHQFIRQEYKADSINVAIQDGPEAGQTVPHLHTHIIPRHKRNNIGDQIYDKLDAWGFEQQLSDWNERRKEYTSTEKNTIKHELAKPDVDRAPRTMEDMSVEAELLNQKLSQYLKENPQLLEYF